MCAIGQPLRCTQENPHLKTNLLQRGPSRRALQSDGQEGVQKCVSTPRLMDGATRGDGVAAFVIAIAERYPWAWRHVGSKTLRVRRIPASVRCEVAEMLPRGARRRGQPHSGAWRGPAQALGARSGRTSWRVVALGIGEKLVRQFKSLQWVVWQQVMEVSQVTPGCDGSWAHSSHSYCAASRLSFLRTYHLPRGAPSEEMPPIPRSWRP